MSENIDKDAEEIEKKENIQTDDKSEQAKDQNNAPQKNQPQWLAANNSITLNILHAMEKMALLEALKKLFREYEETEYGYRVMMHSQQFMAFDLIKNTVTIPRPSVETFESAAKVINESGGKGYDVSEVAKKIDNNPKNEETIANAFIGGKKADENFEISGVPADLKERLQKELEEKKEAAKIAPPTPGPT